MMILLTLLLAKHFGYQYVQPTDESFGSCLRLCPCRTPYAKWRRGEENKWAQAKQDRVTLLRIQAGPAHGVPAMAHLSMISSPFYDGKSSFRRTSLSVSVMLVLIIMHCPQTPEITGQANPLRLRQCHELT
ncbi:hypothetical protein [Pantoea sp. S62]|uniref:hypothetical protein n=1 Tax=Pantoea sp. S62 TaxID=2769342 RepID=UPI001911ED2F|nr:hypothetical protein [Pantoea sp. S62]